MFQYETLWPKNQKVSDGNVIAKACESGFVLVTKDDGMEAEWIEEIIAHRAKVIVLTDQYGNAMHWAAALIASEQSWERILLNHPMGPLVIRVNRNGTVKRMNGESELRKLCQRIVTARIVRAKRRGD